MQIRLVFPFVDYRLLDEQYIQQNLVVKKPFYPILSSKSFIRCGGGKNSAISMHINKCITLHSRDGNSFCVNKKSLEFPFGDKAFGVYHVAITINSFSKRSSIFKRKIDINELFEYLINDIIVTIRVLQDSDRISKFKSRVNSKKTKIQTTISNAKKCLNEHYYLSTLKFIEKDNTTDNYIKITDNDPMESKRKICFTTPLISMDCSNYSRKRIDDKLYYNLGNSISVAEINYNKKLQLLHIRRGLDPFIPFTKISLKESIDTVERYINCGIALKECMMYFDMNDKNKYVKTSSLAVKLLLQYCYDNSDIFRFGYLNGDVDEGVIGGINNKINNAKFLHSDEKNMLLNILNNVKERIKEEPCYPS